MGLPYNVSTYGRDVLPRTRSEIYVAPQDGKLLLSFEGDRRLVYEAMVEEVLDRLQDVPGQVLRYGVGLWLMSCMTVA